MISNDFEGFLPLKMLFYDLNPAVTFEPSAAQGKLAVWLVMVVGIAAGVKFLHYFCAFWDFLIPKSNGCTCPLTFPSLLPPRLNYTYTTKKIVYIGIFLYWRLRERQ